MLNCACTGPEDGVPVVFFHGVSNSMLWWQPLRCELAAEGYRAIGVDSLGHGASPRLGGVNKPRDVFSRSVEAAVGVVEKLSAPAVIIGHSMGGAIATAVAKQVPKKMRGLILADPAWLSVEQERFYAEAAGESVRRTARWQCDPVGALAENTLKRAHWRSTDHLHWLYGQLHVDLGVVASGVVSFPAPWQDYVADLAVPTHVITSGDDCLVGEAGAEAIRGMGRPELTVTYLEGGTHSLPIDLPEAFGAEVRRSLRELGA